MLLKSTQVKQCRVRQGIDKDIQVTVLLIDAMED